MKKWVANVVAFSFMGIIFVALNYILIEKLGNYTKVLYLQDKTVNEMYSMIMHSDVNMQKLRFVLNEFGSSSIVGQFAFGAIFSAVIVFIYKVIIGLFEKYGYKNKKN